ncbi:MAG TPA: maleylpyruvate isomerase family mycothiol-dependent enzyme [Frankiaceae bacterium]|nr:maleylpyruvate isomerase family mycothiol-dependent enzyme [Frankiaceae bacterium]
MTDTFELVARERLRTADLLESLDESQWATPTLCAEWTVRDMAGHLVVPFAVGLPGLLLGMAKARGSFDRFNARAARELARKPVPDLIETLRENARSRFTPPGHPPAAPLTDIAVHTRDIARPLGLDVSAPLDVWREVLGFLVSARAHPAFVRRGRLDGLRLRATDQEWGHGEGAEVAGPSEALALSALGRTVALDDLGGDGVAVLRDRLR